MKWAKQHKNDILLILIPLLLAAGLWGYLHLFRQSGGSVCVTVGGAEIARFPLDEDRVWVWEGGNTVVIENGTARVTEANCPDGICVRHTPIRYAGESIICLPHRLEVAVVGGVEPGVDAVAGGRG